ncbi:MAG: hypothetical protein WKF30_13340 [Pyrinomonadaceae bacterium]
MHKEFLIALASCCVLAVATPPVGAQQTPVAKAVTVAAITPARATVMIPGADAVMFADLKRLFSDVIPRVLADSPARLAEVNADIDQFKAKTGVDPRAFERVTVSVRFAQTATNATRAETVVVANGSFNAGALVAAGRLAAKGKYQEQQLNGKTIYIFSLNEQIKMFGLFKMNVSDVAVAALDSGTLAVGSPETVRAVIETPREVGQRAANCSRWHLRLRTPSSVSAATCRPRRCKTWISATRRSRAASPRCGNSSAPSAQTATTSIS